MSTSLAYDRQNRPWLSWLAGAIFVLGLLLRLSHSSEVPANALCELEAGRRILDGQTPYADFYFDQLMPVVAWRLLTIAVAPVVAMLCDAPASLAACFANIKVLGMAATLTTAALSVASYLACFSIMKKFGAGVFSPNNRWLILLAISVADLSISYEFGQQQHIFLLLFLPYVLTRWTIMQGAALPSSVKVVVAAAAAFGASFSAPYLLVVLAFEAVEALARLNIKLLGEQTFLVFLLFSGLFWLNLFCLPESARVNLYGLILPLRFSFLTHDDFSYYGFYSIPDRRLLFYTAVFAQLLCFGALKRLPVLRPFAALAVCGLVVWMLFVVGLSADALIFTYFTAMLLTLEFYFSALWLTTRYPRLFWRRRETAFSSLVAGAAIFVVIFLVWTEVNQRMLAKTAATRLHATDLAHCPDLTTMIRQHSQAGAPVLIINGKLRPAFPVVMQCDRTMPGYFLGTDILGMLASFRGHPHYDGDLDFQPATARKIEVQLYQRLQADIEKFRPEIILIQGGDIEAAIAQFKLQDYIARHYDRIGEAQYYSDRLGSREVSECNYNYWGYKLKAQAAHSGMPK